VICAAATAFNDVIDDQARASSSIGRRTVRRGAAAMIPCENGVPKLPPRLRTVIGIVDLRPLARPWAPPRRVILRWSHRHSV